MSEGRHRDRLGEYVRCFVACELPDEVREEIGKLVARLRPAGRLANLRWTAPESWHLTLKFVGDVEPRRLADFSTAIAEVVPLHAPLAVALGRPMLFPPGGLPRVVALEITEGGAPEAAGAADAAEAPPPPGEKASAGASSRPGGGRARGPLALLAHDLEEAFLPLRIDREGRAFHPHLTLGRLRGSQGLEELARGIEQERDFGVGELDFDEIVFIQSELGAGEGGGARYTPLGRFRLGG